MASLIRPMRQAFKRLGSRRVTGALPAAATTERSARVGEVPETVAGRSEGVRLRCRGTRSHKTAALPRHLSQSLRSAAERPEAAFNVASPEVAEFGPPSSTSSRMTMTGFAATEEGPCDSVLPFW